MEFSLGQKHGSSANGFADELREKLSLARKDAVGIAAHDLRNPLSLVKMSLDELAQSPQSAETTRVITIAHRGVKQAFDLIDAILDYTKIEYGGLKLEKKPCDFRKFLEDQYVFFEALCREKKLKMEMDYTKLDKTIPCDSIRMIQVLSNLIGNAIKFSPAGSTIQVTAESTSAGGILISIKDQGPGIDPQNKEKIFDRYWQEGRSRHAGIGLGLAIAKSIVEAHDGKIWVDESSELGTTFRFSIPTAH